MQLLFYLLIVIYFVLISGAHDIYNAIMLLYKSRHSVNYKLLYECSLIFIAYGIILVISVLNTLFFKFHIKLVLQNTTTIESLDTEFVKKNKVK
jgi:palmitoyltransferase